MDVCMHLIELNKHFSTARLSRYLSACGGDAGRAASAYSHNLLVAESLFPLLNVLEIALRNAVHARLSAMYGRADWWLAWDGHPDFVWQLKEVHKAKGKLLRRRESINADKVVAELTFAFWGSLFNANYQDELWKSLRLAFPNCPKVQRKRQNVSAVLNKLRHLRNRVFHHEPLLWLAPSVIDLHNMGVETVGWFDPKLAAWLERYDRLTACWADWLKRYPPAGIPGTP